MNLRLITAPVVEPVSLAAAKSYLRVDASDDDVLIASLIKAAREKGEELSRRAFITQTWEMTVDSWPSNRMLTLFRPRLQSVTYVKYTDRLSVESAWADFRVNIKSEPGTIIFDSLPGGSLQENGGITVRFVAGYGSADTNVPEQIKQMVLALVAYWYENRESQNVPADIKRAFMAERVVWF